MRHIDARNIALSEVLRFQIQLEHTLTPAGVQAMDGDIPYESCELPLHLQPAFVKHVKQPLRQRFHHVRTVALGAVDRKPLQSDAETWLVSLPIPEGESSLLPLPSTPPKAHAEVVRSRRYDDGALPDTIIPIPTPSADYTIRERFDLELCWQDGERTNFADWLNALEHDPIFGDLNVALRVGTLSVTLEILAGLIRKQVERGHEVLLSTIMAYRVAPWRMDSFDRLAGIAGESLGVLILTDMSDDYQPRHAIASFSDLPQITEAVRNNCPNLQHFHLALSGISTAESVCAGLLAPVSLTQRVQCNRSRSP